MKKSILLFIICNLLVFGCAKDEISFGIGDKVRIDYGQKVRISDNGRNMTIKFTDLLDDSRCPEDVQCIWAGRAVVKITINSKEEVILALGDLSTGTETPYVNTAVYKNFTITLLEVNRDKENEKFEKEDYNIVIQVLEKS